MTDKELIQKEDVHRIVGCAMEVPNTLGHGFHEKIYENALVVEFGIQQISFQQQSQFPIIYKGAEVGKFIPDLICFESVVVDAKVVDELTDREVGQMVNYLKITGHKVGVLLNFKNAKLEWKRVVR